jgi:hypothetical protein
VTAAPLLGVAAVAVTAIAAALVVLPALAGAAMFVLQALADTAGTLGAMVYAALGPLGVLAALLGGLGVAFGYAAEQSFKLRSDLGAQHDLLLKMDAAQKYYNAEVTKYGAASYQAENALVSLHKAQDAYQQSQLATQLGALHLGDTFSTLVKTISRDFAPEILGLARAASVALKYFTHLANMPLAQAFHSLATTGARMLSRFLYDVGNVLARPFRLAIRLAFDTGTAEHQAQGLLHSLGGFLFGKTVSVPVGARRGPGFAMGSKQVPGALTPIVNWFNRQDFTKTGKRWGNEMVDGFLKSGAAHRLGQWAGSVLTDAGHRGGKAFVSAIAWEVTSAVPRLLKWMVGEIQNALGAESRWQIREAQRVWNWVKQEAGAAWRWITQKAGDAWGSIKSKASDEWSQLTTHLHSMWSSFTSWITTSIGTAWGAIKTKIEGIWDTIVSYITRPLSIHINWPSPPSWLSSLPGMGALGSVTSAIKHHTAAGGIFTRPTSVLAGESGAEAIIPLTGGMGRHVLSAFGGGGGGINVNIINPTFLTGGRAAARELARTLKPELDRIVSLR